MKVYKLFTNPEDTAEHPLTWDSLMLWLASTHFVEGRVGSIISPLDRPYLEDYIGECWLLILSVPKPKILELWYKGKGKFVNYLKSIILHNVNSTSSPLYKNLRKSRKPEVYLDDEQWHSLRSSGSANIDIYFPQVNRDNYYTRVGFESETINIKTDQSNIQYGNT